MVSITLETFLRHWHDSSYARLEVGHRLAASLCLTDVPDDMDVRAPWSAWALVIPDGLLGDYARVFCLGTKVIMLATRNGAFVGDASLKIGERELLRSLVLGCCLALSNPEDFKKGTVKSHGRGGKGNKRGQKLPMESARYMLSAPVKIDFRQAVRETLEGSRKGSSPKVQFYVRGHWRNQAYGPQHTLRRQQWIEPFWKGDPEARILLRGHQVEPDSRRA